jgi:hypothetical protein
VCRQSSSNGSTGVEFEVLSGSVELASFALQGVGEIVLDEPATVREGETLNLSFAS